MIDIQPSAATAAPRGRGTGKWGDVALAGFAVVPDVLLVHQKRLGLSATDLCVLLNVVSHWWDQDRLPFPRPDSIAKRMDLNVRTVQRSIRKLLELGYVAREDVVRPNGRVVRALNLDGLIGALDQLVKADPRLSAKLERYKKLREERASSIQ